MSHDLAFPFAVSTILAMMAVDTGVNITPRAGMDEFFRVQSITAERAGETAVLQVQREVLRPVHMEFTVRVMSRGRQGWVEFCSMSSGVILYMPDTELPDPVTLDWWTWGECPVLPPGPARIVTTWAPEPPGLEPITLVSEVK